MLLIGVGPRDDLAASGIEIAAAEAFLAARRYRASIMAVDSAFVSPALQQPLEPGADIVLRIYHRAWQVLGGALLGDAETIAKCRQDGLRFIIGATLSPMAGTFFLRGLKTLALRMERRRANALAVAQILEAHPTVA